MTPPFRFKPSDFIAVHGGPPMGALAADTANAVLDAHLKTLKSMHCYLYDGFIIADGAADDTHVATIWSIEPIEKPKPCEHDPGFVIKSLCPTGSIQLSHDKYECLKCGAKLKAKWEVAE